MSCTAVKSDFWIMWAKKILFYLLCAHKTFSFEDEWTGPEPASGEAKDRIMEYLMHAYPTRKQRGYPKVDPGTPLILTPFIEQGRAEEARKLAVVDPDYLLPDIDSYAGYLTVNKKYNSNLWFWYFPVMDKPVEKTPWIIWFQGGPGASSLYGLFTEIGPFEVKDDYLEEMKYSWGKNYSLLFIDNPVGTGYSFTDDDSGYVTNQITIGENLYTALQQFLTLFPELRKAPLTIAGESYAGKHIPSIAIQIHRNKNNEKPINLHGLAIGNGFIDPKSLQNYSAFVRQVGLVDDKVADKMRYLEMDIMKFIESGNMLKAFAYYNYLLGLFMHKSHLGTIYHYLKDDISLDGVYLDYIQKPEVRRALHVGSTNFTSIGVVYNKLVPDFMGSAKIWLEELLDHYKVMLYYGHLDVIVPYYPSSLMCDTLKFSGSTKFKNSTQKPWIHKKKLAGYYQSGGNLLKVLIRGAGHMVPADQPAASLALITSFIRGNSLSEDTAALVDDDDDKHLLPKRRPFKI